MATRKHFRIHKVIHAFDSTGRDNGWLFLYGPDGALVTGIKVAERNRAERWLTEHDVAEQAMNLRDSIIAAGSDCSLNHILKIDHIPAVEAKQ